MFTLSLDSDVLQCFANFIALYLGRAPDSVEIKEFIEFKCKEKGIVEVYKNKIITQDEFIDFLLTHIYTNFVLYEKDIRDVSDGEIEKIRNKIKTLLFVNII